MISFKNFLVSLPIILSSAAPKLSKVADSGGIHSSKNLAARVVLNYKGSVTGAYSMVMGIEVTIDTLVGVRYEVTLTGAINSHMALFYKFSNPKQTIFYNFITHKSYVNKESGSPDSDPNVAVIGTEAIGAYSCTHLQHGAGTHEISDYWMSSQIPGFSELMNALKNINANLPGMAFNGTIFRWGGLVKMKIVGMEEKGNLTMNLHLDNAKINIPLRSDTFEVPSQ